MNCNSSANSSVSFFCFIDPFLLKIEVLTLTLELIFSLIGNCLVFMTITLRRYSKSNNRRLKKNSLSRMDFFILQLSLADTYGALGNILPTVNSYRTIVKMWLYQYYFNLDVYVSCYFDRVIYRVKDFFEVHLSRLGDKDAMF